MKKIIFSLILAIPSIVNAQDVFEATVISTSGQNSGIAILHSGEMVSFNNEMSNGSLAPGMVVALSVSPINDPTRPMFGGALDIVDPTRPMFGGALGNADQSSQMGSIDDLDRTRPMRVIAVK